MMHLRFRPSTWLKRTMFINMVLLGLQLCCPAPLQASLLSTQQVDMASLGVKDPADEPGIRIDFDFPPTFLGLLPVPARLAYGVCKFHEADRTPAPSVLPVSGYHPSAP